MPPSRDDLRARVAAQRWFHTIDLGDGVVTPGEDASLRKLPQQGLTEQVMRGRSVLDIGAWDGFFSFIAEERGAARVVAMDPACWGGPAWGDRGWGTRAGFDLAHAALGSRVEALDPATAIEDVSPASVGHFDVVLFLGVLYHLPDPWPVLAAAASVATERLVVETHVDLLHVRRPAVAHYPGAELAGDPSNWWGPNVPMLRAQLRALGFRQVEVVHLDRFGRRLARSAYRAARGRRYSAAQGRCVIHAIR